MRAFAATSKDADGTLVLESVPALAVAEGIGRTTAAADLALSCVEKAAGPLGTAAHATNARRDTRQALDLLAEGIFGQAESRILADPETSGRMATGLLLVVLSQMRAHIYAMGGGVAFVVRDGAIHAITRSRPSAMLGAEATGELDTAELLLAHNDVIVLVSRKLLVRVGEEAIGKAFRTPPESQDYLQARLRELTGGRAGMAAFCVTTGSNSDAIGFAQALGEASLFRGLSVPDRLAVMPYLEEQELQPGEVLIREGDTGRDFFVVLFGRLRVTHGGTVLRELSRGDSLGELALAGADLTRSATVTAIGSARVLCMPADRFDELVQRRGDIGTKLLQAMFAIAGERIRDLTHRLSKQP